MADPWAQDMIDTMAETQEENCRLREALAFVNLVLRYPQRIPTGISSGVMIGYAIGGAIPDPAEYPRDEDDLGRCVGVRRVAPAELHTRMDEVLALYRAALGERP